MFSPFIPLLSVIDFSQLYKMSHILDKAGLSTVPPFKLTDEFISSHSSSLLEMYNVRVRVDGLNTLQELVVKGQFAAAKEYAQVADIPTAEVTLKEVRGRGREGGKERKGAREGGREEAREREREAVHLCHKI